MQVLFFHTHASILAPSSQTISKCPRNPRTGLYQFPAHSTNFHLNLASHDSHPDLFNLWHQHLGHIHRKSLIFMSQKSIVTGMPPVSASPQTCKACALGKQSRKRAPKRSSNRSSVPLGLIHNDLCGPFATPSLSGAKYILTFTDDCSRYCWVYFLSTKHSVPTIFHTFRTLVEAQLGHRIVVIMAVNIRLMPLEPIVRHTESPNSTLNLTPPTRTGLLSEKTVVYST